MLHKSSCACIKCAEKKKLGIEKDMAKQQCSCGSGVIANQCWGK